MIDRHRHHHRDRLHEPVETHYGPVLGLPELGANKLIAALTRYEPRDLVDLAAVCERVPFAELVDLAAAKAPGLGPGPGNRVRVQVPPRAPL
jgi:hypothetical protein